VRVIKGDIVEVQVGNQAAADRPNKVRGKVLRVIPKDGRVVVEGVNRHYKHVKRSQKYPQGGRVQRELPIDLSNVMPVCPKCDKGVRVSFKEDNGAKVRVCRKCGTVLHQLRKASAKKA
jgi:large subunit ribosomal protein L24